MDAPSRTGPTAAQSVLRGRSLWQKGDPGPGTGTVESHLVWAHALPRKEGMSGEGQAHPEVGGA